MESCILGPRGPIFYTLLKVVPTNLKKESCVNPVEIFFVCKIEENLNLFRLVCDQKGTENMAALGPIFYTHLGVVPISLKTSFM